MTRTYLKLMPTFKNKFEFSLTDMLGLRDVTAATVKEVEKELARRAKRRAKRS